MTSKAVHLRPIFEHQREVDRIPTAASLGLDEPWLGNAYREQPTAETILSRLKRKSCECPAPDGASSPTWLAVLQGGTAAPPSTASSCNIAQKPAICKSYCGLAAMNEGGLKERVRRCWWADARSKMDAAAFVASSRHVLSTRPSRVRDPLSHSDRTMGRHTDIVDHRMSHIATTCPVRIILLELLVYTILLKY